MLLISKESINALNAKLTISTITNIFSVVTFFARLLTFMIYGFPKKPFPKRANKKIWKNSQRVSLNSCSITNYPRSKIQDGQEKSGGLVENISYIENARYLSHWFFYIKIAASACFQCFPTILGRYQIIICTIMRKSLYHIE